MLPIFRTISVGGVLLAITILALALSPPGGSHMRLAAAGAPASGALQAQSNHPEWRQFLILAALRRAGELGRLRDLPDTPMQLPEIPAVATDYVPVELPAPTLAETPKDAARTAGLPAARADADPEEETGSINATPGATIPIEIGEPSSTELPVNPVEDKPPVIGIPLTETPEPIDQAPRAMATDTPEPVKPPVERRARSVQHHRAPARAQAPTSPYANIPPPFNLLQALFDSLLNQPPPKVATDNKAHVKAKRTATIHAAAQ
jgi:hypothetical protein